jgi:hypothetical protein
MEEHIARLLAGVGILVWGLLAMVSLFLEWRHAEVKTPESGQPSGASKPSSQSRAV